MDFFSGKGLGCLAIVVIAVGMGLACPFMASGPSTQMILETKEVTCAPGELFNVPTKFYGGAGPERRSYAFSAKGPDNGPVWSFREAGSDGAVLGGNALAMKFLAPSRPGTYTLTAKFPGFFGDKKHCKINVATAGGISGPALGMNSLGVKADGSLVRTWALEPVLEGCSTTLLKDGSVLIAGGWKPNEQTGPLASSVAFRYWPSERRIQSVGPLCRPRAEQEAALLPDGRVLLLGGGDKPEFLSSSSNDTGEFLTDGEIFDPATNRFDSGISLGMSCFAYRISVIPGGEVLLYPYLDPWSQKQFNFDAKRPMLPEAHLLNTKTKAMAGLGPVQCLRDLPTLTSMKDGRVLIMGAPFIPTDRDRELAPDPRAMVEFFLTDRKSFSPGPETRFGRRDHAAVLLNNGKVWILGGWMSRWAAPGGSGRTLPDRSEIFDPATGSFTESEPLSYVLAHSTAQSTAVLRDGSVLISADGQLHRLNPGLTGNGTAALVHPTEAGIRTVTSLLDGHVLALGGFPYGARIYYP